MKALGNMYPFCPDVWLFHSREKCVDWYEKRTGTKPDLFESDAQTTYLGGEAVVLIEVKDEPAWENALLVHEAYHVVCNHLSAIGEDEPGEETVAYMVQCVSGALMKAHEKWRSKHVGIED